MCSKYEWMVWEVSINFEVLKCWSWNWENSSDFELFDIWKVIYIDLDGTGPQKNFDISVFLIYKVQYISEFI